MDSQSPTPELLVWAYRRGIFPMFDSRAGRIEYFSPDPRTILPLDHIHVSKSLRRRVRSERFQIRSDTRFEQVMRACAASRRGRRETWIDERLVSAYCGLHELGLAHSIEAWRDDALVGGLYGVHLGAAFFGESMFSRPDLGGTDASKVCLVWLVEQLREAGFQLLDVQFTTPHLERFGALEIPRELYLSLLERALTHEAPWISG
jgi:leucyl/phenylalanyl-tRNA--protein transferase